MQDTVTPEARSRLMSRVRGQDTGPEMHVRRALWTDGFRYRVHVGDLPAPPTWPYRSIGLPCLFTAASGTSTGARSPGAQLPIGSFGTRKLDANISRDARNRTALEDLGWTVTTVWECKLEKDTESLLTQLKGIRSNGEADYSVNPIGFVSICS